ncbi:hypothetical protein HYH03_000454 [Edaphochlamys debaryana]|uniref:Uncharacterized protein n=1 Tax=Edaphochlamys debaryana TaxID=47281 RepID=A0A836C670_9CHLO|nr:hypothetical protein HYH03_000454 [Edaphochlamys debaryana]|eukprot:KAG2501956.1 hypothetical protein HYH03_000454 [Edaphochlamys debaryana]
MQPQASTSGRNVHSFSLGGHTRNVVRHPAAALVANGAGLSGRPVLALRPTQRSTDRWSSLTAHGLWSVDAVFTAARKKRFEEKTVERVYEADVYPAVFDFAAWHQHRSRNRYVEHCVTLFRSYFFRDLLGPLVILVGTAVAVGVYSTLAEEGYLPSYLPTLRDVSDTPFQLTSFALSLMLVFRTNSSYARWLDARQQWGLIVNTSRTFVRQCMTTLPESSCSEVRDALARWTIAFVRLSKLHLREHGDVVEEMKDLLRGEEIPLVAVASHRPLAASHVLSELLRHVEAAGRIDGQARARLEADVSMMSQAMGACEKILRNPIPLSYTRHTSRFLILWLLWLPIALWSKAGWCVVPVEAILCYLLLGIDEIAIQMEEPFGILPLENFCDAVQQSVEQVAGMDHVIADVISAYHCNDTCGPAAPAGVAAAAAGPALVNGGGTNGVGTAEDLPVDAPPLPGAVAMAAAVAAAVEEKRHHPPAPPPPPPTPPPPPPSPPSFWGGSFGMPADRC